MNHYLKSRIRKKCRKYWISCANSTQIGLKTKDTPPKTILRLCISLICYYFPLWTNHTNEVLNNIFYQCLEFTTKLNSNSVPVNNKATTNTISWTMLNVQVTLFGMLLSHSSLYFLDVHKMPDIYEETTKIMDTSTDEFWVRDIDIFFNREPKIFYCLL